MTDLVQGVVKSMTRKLVGVMAVVAVLVALLLVMGIRDRWTGLDQTVHFERVAGFNEPIRYDDFAFAALAVTQTRTLGSSTAQGLYTIVTLRVTNDAKRVQYKFDDKIAVLMDARGKRYPVSRAGPADACAVALDPGGSCVTELVFDAPAEIRPLYLAISMGGPLGDLVDNVLYGSKAIRLQ